TIASPAGAPARGIHRRQARAAHQLAGDRGIAMDELRAELDRQGEARRVACLDPSADALARLEQQHRTTRRAQLGCGTQTGGSCPDNRDVKILFSSAHAPIMQHALRDAKTAMILLGCLRDSNNDDGVAPGGRAMSQSDSKVSRREVLTAGIAATGTLLAASRAGATVNPDAKSGAGIAGRKFRAWVSQGEGEGRTRLETLTMLPVTGRMVAVRTQAASLCYTVSSDVLGLPRGAFGAPDTAHLLHVPPAPATYEALQKMAIIQGHGGVGIVEAVGPHVRRVKVGDRVCVSGTPQCGSCYQCLRGRADMCQFLYTQGPD